jgi:hypothetical protein
VIIEKPSAFFSKCSCESPPQNQRSGHNPVDFIGSVSEVASEIKSRIAIAA